MKFFLLLLSLSLFSPSLLAHDEAIGITQGNEPKGPVHLPEKQARAIDLKVAPVTLRPMKNTLSLNGEIQLFPNAQADVSVRFSGQVTEIYINVGDQVRKGQRLAKVQSRQIGDPPPSIVVTALRDGIVDTRNINVGQAVEPNTVLFRISDRSQMLMLANVYEEDLGKITVGQTAEIKVLSYPNKVFTGKVTRIEPNLNAATRTVKIWIVLDNSQGLLKPNLFALADILLKENRTVLTLPNEAILEANHEFFVFVRKGENYQRVMVKTGANNDRYTEIVSGLAAGDEAVTQGNRQLYTLWLTGGAIHSTHKDD